ncbi:MAG TPA: SRPBCC domain-containing protein [Spirochaetia bacterium]|nr:SRPBCC domain-containing protein [Spirochaetia bacterium]
MSNRDFSTTIVVEQSPAKVFDAVNKPRVWWSEDIEGTPEKLDSEWTYQFQDNHRCKMRTVEMVHAKKVVWLVEDNWFAFTKDKTEWIGNRITFDNARQDDRTQLIFTQFGLVPTYECFNACRDAWTGFIQRNLRSFITTGKGELKWYEQP